MFFIITVIKNINEDKIIFMISHRMASVHIADEIWFMKDGKIHRELEKNDIENLHDSDIRAFKLRTFKLSNIKYELKDNLIVNKQNADFKVENLSARINFHIITIKKVMSKGSTNSHKKPIF